MENTYEEAIVKAACEKLRKTKGIKIEVLSVTIDTDLRVIMTFKMGEHNQTMSCVKDIFHNVSKAMVLPLVNQLVKPELLNRLHERSFIILCFAAWFYKVGKHYNYF